MTIATRPLPVRPLPPPPAAARRAGAANATLVERHDVGRSAALFSLCLDAPLIGYRPGQYVAVGLPSAGQIVLRPYSLVSLSDTARLVELLVRRVDGGALSPRLWQIRPGARLHVGPPRGLFVLDALDRRQRLLVGAGTGLAPLLAMLEAAARAGDGVPSTLIHGVSFEDELVFGDRIAGWQRSGLKLDYLPTVSRSDDARNRNWTGPIGRAEAQLSAYANSQRFDPRNVVAYVCGSPPMVDACTARLRGAGMPDEAVRVERF